MHQREGGDTDTSPGKVIDERWVAERLDRLWPAHTQWLADLLIILRKNFDGDLDALLIMLVIAIGSRSENWEQLLLASESAFLQRPTNTATIAHISGIPRESVRRKLKILADKGWVQRGEGGNGCWSPAWPTTSPPAQRRPSTTSCASLTPFNRRDADRY